MIQQHTCKVKISSSPAHSPCSSTGPTSERKEVKDSMRPLWSTRTIRILYLSNSTGQMALSTCASTKSLRSSKLSSASPGCVQGTGKKKHSINAIY